MSAKKGKPSKTAAAKPAEAEEKEAKAEIPDQDGDDSDDEPDDGSGIVKPKIPKGTRDTHPEQMAIRERAFALIKGVFLRHGAVGIDTPVFEKKATLTGKYGEDTKLIYDLANQGGEILALRYDLTVPFARYVAKHRVKKIKRYHIARVYRRDQPAMNRGRFREFYQCDYDIAGEYDTMVPDSEVIKVLCDVLDELNIGTYEVKVNHRKLLDAMMAVCGVPADKFRAICSAIDKLDKEEWSKVKEEMVSVKHLDPAVADRIGEYVTKVPPPPKEFLAQLKQGELAKNPLAVEAFNDLTLLFDYLDWLGCLDKVCFNLSLARGLDYYTGVIYEAALTSGVSVGSIAAGGRYDGLVGMFCSTKIPAVGVSIGIERILAILEEIEVRKSGGKVRKSQTQVFVASIGKNMLQHRMQICQLLWKNNIRAEFLYHASPKPAPQLEYTNANDIPISIWIGENELKSGQVQIKDMLLHSSVEVPREELIPRLKALIAEKEGSAGSAVPAPVSAPAAAAAGSSAAGSSASAPAPAPAPSAGGALGADERKQFIRRAEEAERALADLTKRILALEQVASAPRVAAPAAVVPAVVATAVLTVTAPAPAAAAAAAAAAGHSKAAPKAAEDEKEEKFESGHQHYNDCENNTEARFKARDCGCQQRSSSHMAALIALARQTGKSQVADVPVAAAEGDDY